MLNVFFHIFIKLFTKNISKIGCIVVIFTAIPYDFKRKHKQTYDFTYILTS